MEKNRDIQSETVEENKCCSHGEEFSFFEVRVNLGGYKTQKAAINNIFWNEMDVKIVNVKTIEKYEAESCFISLDLRKESRWDSCTPCILSHPAVSYLEPKCSVFTGILSYISIVKESFILQASLLTWSSLLKCLLKLLKIEK